MSKSSLFWTGCAIALASVGVYYAGHHACCHPDSLATRCALSALRLGLQCGPVHQEAAQQVPEKPRESDCASDTCQFAALPPVCEPQEVIDLSQVGVGTAPIPLAIPEGEHGVVTGTGHCMPEVCPSVVITPSDVEECEEKKAVEPPLVPDPEVPVTMPPCEDETVPADCIGACHSPAAVETAVKEAVLDACWWFFEEKEAWPDKQPLCEDPSAKQPTCDEPCTEPCEKPVCDKPCSKAVPCDQVCDEPCDEPAKKPCDKVCDEPCDEPTVKPSAKHPVCDQVCDEPCDKPAAKATPCDKVCDEPCDKPASKPADGSAEESEAIMGGKPVDMKVDPSYHQEYPGCPYKGCYPSTESQVGETVAPEPSAQKKSHKKKKKKQARDCSEGEPCEPPLNLDECPVPKAPATDTMEFRKSDAKKGEFKPKPW